MTKIAELQDIYQQWEDAHPGEDLDMRVVAQWANETGRWTPRPYNPVHECAKELARAAREEKYVDPQGREVHRRVSYSYTDEQGQKRWRFTDIVNAEPEKMAMSAQHRRRASLGDIISIKNDLTSWNENNPYGATIQMSFNFDEDLAELEHPTEYPAGPEQV